MRCVTEVSWDACMSAVRFHTYRAFWEGQTGLDPSPTPRSPALVLLQTPAARSAHHHLVLVLPLLHQVPTIIPDSALGGIARVLRVSGPLGKHVLAASAQDHLDDRIRTGGLGAWPACCLCSHSP